jgi:hypothetical protein
MSDQDPNPKRWRRRWRTFRRYVVTGAGMVLTVVIEKTDWRGVLMKLFGGLV